MDGKILSHQYQTDINNSYISLSEKEQVDLAMEYIKNVKVDIKGDVVTKNQKAVDAQNKLVNAFLRAIRTIAKSYASNANPIDTLMGAGVQGLITHIHEYDSSLAGFFTFITPHIRNEISYVVYDNETIRRPRNRVKQKAVKPIYDKDGNLTNAEEVLAQDANKINYASLNAPIDTDDSSSGTIEDMVPDTEAESQLDQITSKETVIAINSALDELSERDRKVVEMYFGFGKHEPMTHQEIGDVNGFSRQNAHTIHSRAMVRVAEKIKQMRQKELV